MYTKAKFLVSRNTFLCVVLLYVLTIYIFTFSPSSLSCIAFFIFTSLSLMPLTTFLPWPVCVLVPEAKKGWEGEVRGGGLLWASLSPSCWWEEKPREKKTVNSAVVGKGPTVCPWRGSGVGLLEPTRGQMRADPGSTWRGGYWWRGQIKFYVTERAECSLEQEKLTPSQMESDFTNFDYFNCSKHCSYSICGSRTSCS